MLILFFVIIIAPIVIAIIVGLKKPDDSSKSRSSYVETEEYIAGKRGERIASSIILDVLDPEDALFTNVNISYKDKPAELDNVIVNKYGVFIIEVKSFNGTLIGNEDDYVWKKYKETDSKNVYENKVKNPIRQVKRQVYIMAKYLQAYGVDVWVEGYVYLLYGKSTASSRYILDNASEIRKAVHSSNKNRLNKNQIEQIKKILRSPYCDENRICGNKPPFLDVNKLKK